MTAEVIHAAALSSEGGKHNAGSSPARGSSHVASLNWEPPLLSARTSHQPPPQRRRPVSATCSEDADGLPSEGSEGSRAAKSARTALSTENSRNALDAGGGGKGGFSVGSHQKRHKDEVDEAAAGRSPPKTRRSRSEKDLANIKPSGGGATTLPPAVGSQHPTTDSSGGDSQSSTVLAMFKAQQIGSGPPPPIRGGGAPPSSSNLPPMGPPAISRANRLANSSSSNNVGAPNIPPPAAPAAPTAMPQTTSPNKQAHQRAQQPSPQRGSGGCAPFGAIVGGGGMSSPLPPLLPRLGQATTPPNAPVGGAAVRLISGSIGARVADGVAADGEGQEGGDGAGIGIPRSRFLASLARDPAVPSRSGH